MHGRLGETRFLLDSRRRPVVHFAAAMDVQGGLAGQPDAVSDQVTVNRFHSNPIKNMDRLARLPGQHHRNGFESGACFDSLRLEAEALMDWRVTSRAFVFVRLFSRDAPFWYRRHDWFVAARNNHKREVPVQRFSRSEA